jgi:hypothetical protein
MGRAENDPRSANRVPLGFRVYGIATRSQLPLFPSSEVSRSLRATLKFRAQDSCSSPSETMLRLMNTGRRRRRVYPQAPQWAPRDYGAPCGKGPSSLARGSRVLLVDTRGRMSLLQRHRVSFWSTSAPRLQMASLKCDCRRRGSQGRVFATGNEGRTGLIRATPPSEDPQSAASSSIARPER